MAQKRPRSFKDLEGWRGEQRTRQDPPKKKNLESISDSKKLESTLSKYPIPVSYPPKGSDSNIPQLEDIDYFNIDLTPEIIDKVDSDSRLISKNNRNLEQKIKAEIAGINVFKKLGHFGKTAISKDYRDSTADDLINSQLKVSASFRDSIKNIYLKLNEELNKNTQNLNNLENNYFNLINKREQVKKEIRKSQEDYLLLKKTLDNENLKGIDREKLKIGKTNAHRKYRKSTSELDEINNAIVTNVQEREFNYTSEIIFERYEGAFRKIYDTAESEIRKIDRVKGLYLNAMRGGRIVKHLEKSFEEVFASLRIMDNVLLKGISSLLESSSGRGRIRELRDEKSESTKKMLKTLKDSYVPDAEKLNRIVEGYIRDE
jgi:hypothetical protein